MHIFIKPFQAFFLARRFDNGWRFSGFHLHFNVIKRITIHSVNKYILYS